MSMAYIAAIVAVGTTAVSIDQSRAAERAQKRSLLAQNRAQAVATRKQAHTDHLAKMDKAKANKKRVDAQQYMAKAAAAASQGPASTLMSGGGGTSLLGGQGTLV